MFDSPELTPSLYLSFTDQEYWIGVEGAGELEGANADPANGEALASSQANGLAPAASAVPVSGAVSASVRVLGFSPAVSVVAPQGAASASETARGEMPSVAAYRPGGLAMETNFPFEKFRLLYPQFAGFSDAVISLIAGQAECYLAAYCAGRCDEQLWMLLVAHMLQLRLDAEDGNSATGAVTSASIDKVSVSFAAPSSASSWAHWLNLTPFGLQFQALYKRCSSGGRYTGVFAERAAFRNVGGRFTRRGRF